MTVETNHSLSVDCVIFGYDPEGLKVLLVKQRKHSEQIEEPKRMKLPGSMIYENETLPEAAMRVLRERTGLDKVYLKQTKIFSDPERVVGDELEWIARYHGIMTRRVVTVGYYALVQITPKILKHTNFKGAEWRLCDKVEQLAMDHTQILSESLKALRSDFDRSPIAFELLPKRFTVRELQNLYSAVMGVELDNRNFRKKILGAGILKPTGERERGVAHKPAEFFTFSLSAYNRSDKRCLHVAYV